MSYTGSTPIFGSVVETAPKNTAIPTLNVDWLLGEVHYKDISSDSVITFSNLVDGKTLLVILNNTDISPHLITFPVGIKVNGDYDGNVEAMTESVFTFVRSNGKIYMTEVKELA